MPNFLTRTAVIAVTVAALTPVMAASADTNKNQQDSMRKGPTASVLSLVGGSSSGASGQIAHQDMAKAHTTNNSLIDYWGQSDGTSVASHGGKS
ncbi:hypothetical protein [Streptomyces sp. I05A-00742]|uniref:hypothetical protein n=1 Tax=Streptomyces sp. I05A-00742 TaxID=2732853 RepID=UPI001488DD5E|nr:hypothetical protein [Streptomyces sp. I05A-00742]